ncbi:MAG: hypothetical protein R3E79_48240 [Caldilineaceae bacterium]
MAASDLEELCAHLARHRERLWTAPVATIAQRVQQFQGRQVELMD